MDSWIGRLSHESKVPELRRRLLPMMTMEARVFGGTGEGHFIFFARKELIFCSCSSWSSSRRRFRGCCLFVCLSVWLFVCLFVCLFFCLFVLFCLGCCCCCCCFRAHPEVEGEMPSEEKLLDAMQRLNGALQVPPQPCGIIKNPDPKWLLFFPGCI